MSNLSNIPEKLVKLSCCVTFCRQKDYIVDALESIVNQQTNFEFEVLVGLDGYCPESEKIINSYVEAYPRVSLYQCDHSKLQSISIEKASRNRVNLLKHSKGEYFCLLDGDDYYTDMSRFQVLTDLLDSRPELVGCAHAYTVCRGCEKVGQLRSIGNEEQQFDILNFLAIAPASGLIPACTETFSVRAGLPIFPNFSLMIVP